MNRAEPMFQASPLRLGDGARWAIGIYIAFAVIVDLMLVAGADGAVATALVIAWIWMIPVFAIDQFLLVHRATFAVSILTWACAWLLMIPFTGMPGNSTDTVKEIAGWFFWASLACILGGHLVKWFFAEGGRSD
jgi:hypothetical protein